MGRLSDGLRNLWHSLLGRKRIPRNHDDLYDYCEAAGQSVGHLERDGVLLDGDPPAVQVVAGQVRARIANLSQRLGKRLNRIKAKAKRYNRKAERHENSAKDRRVERPDVEPMIHAVIDFFASRVLVYLAAFGLVVWTLEATGMLTSLMSYEAVLGPVRFPMSWAAGAILVGAGHGAGHLIHSALEDRNARVGYLVGAAIVLVIGVVTVAWLGIGRDANTKAADSFNAVGVLQHEATQLDERAEERLEPLPQLPAEQGVPKPSAADRRIAAHLHRQAERKRQQATQLDAEARDERTLTFFAPVQILGLAVGAIGGFFFAAAAPTREYRRLTKWADWHDRRAVHHRAREDGWSAKAEDIEAAIGRLGTEEHAWGEVSLGHHEQNRLVARGSARSTRAHSPDAIVDLIRGAISPADLNGGSGPDTVADAQSEER